MTYVYWHRRIENTFKCLNKNGLKTRLLHRASLRGPRSNTRRTARGRFMRERQQQQQQQQREALSCTANHLRGCHARHEEARVRRQQNFGFVREKAVSGAAMVSSRGDKRAQRASRGKQSRNAAAEARGARARCCGCGGGGGGHARCDAAAVEDLHPENNAALVHEEV